MAVFIADHEENDYNPTPDVANDVDTNVYLSFGSAGAEAGHFVIFSTEPEALNTY